MNIENVSINDIVPYENNPRKNDKAVDVVAKSIQEFGFLVPIILDDKNVIVAGHTRVKAALKLGISEVPVIYTEGLTDQQIKAFRIMDNKSSEYAQWDEEKLKIELKELKNLGVDLDLTGFSKEELKLNELDDFIDITERILVIQVNPPESPVLKERVMVYFKNKEDYDRFKEIFNDNYKINGEDLLNKLK